MPCNCSLETCPSASRPAMRNSGLTAAGVLFTMPALVLLGPWRHFDFLQTTLIAGFGGILGVLFTVPLRRALGAEFVLAPELFLCGYPPRDLLLRQSAAQPCRSQMPPKVRQGFLPTDLSPELDYMRPGPHPMIAARAPTRLL